MNNNNDTFYPQKNLSMDSQKYGLGIRDPEKTFPGSSGKKSATEPALRGQKSTVSQMLIRNTGTRTYCTNVWYMLYRRKKIFQSTAANLASDGFSVRILYTTF